MSPSVFSIGEASIAQATPAGSAKKAPAKRTSVAIADRKVAPEPR